MQGVPRLIRSEKTGANTFGKGGRLGSEVFHFGTLIAIHGQKDAESLVGFMWFEAGQNLHLAVSVPDKNIAWCVCLGGIVPLVVPPPEVDKVPAALVDP
jgi:hypothetical protein